MQKLHFDKSEVRRVIEHALAAPEHGRGWGDAKPPRPQMILVKDEGIYLMSNGEPRDLAGDPKMPERCFVAYARSFDPKTDADVWDRAQAAVGGDDFSEYIDISADLAEAIRAGHGFIIGVSESRLAVFTVPPATKEG